MVRVLIAAVCNTDLEIMKGYMGFAGVVGHEFVGIVESAPAGQEALVGKGRRPLGTLAGVRSRPDFPQPTHESS